MGFSKDLLDGTAGLLDTGGVGAYRPNGPPFTAGETAIVLSSTPDAPDRVLCLTTYTVDDSDLTDAVMAVQVKMRAGTDPRGVLDLSDAVFDALHNRRSLIVGTTHVELMWRQSETSMGQDVHGRDTRSANYYAQLSRAAAHLYE